MGEGKGDRWETGKGSNVHRRHVGRNNHVCVCLKQNRIKYGRQGTWHGKELGR